MSVNLPAARANQIRNAPPRHLISAAPRAAGMYYLSLFTLILASVILPHGGVSDVYSQLVVSQLWPLALVAVCWLVIVADALVGILQAPDKFLPPLRRALLLAVMPVARLTVASAIPNRYVWLPRLGWLPVNRLQQEAMELRLALPMLLITLLILPVVGAEIFFREQLQASPLLALLVHLVAALIWLAFVYEFVVLLSLAEKKLDYCKRNWINIVIILLPLLSFLSNLQLLRFLRLSKAGKLVRAYRLRGLMARALRLALMLNLIERLLQRNLQGYVEHLHDKVAEKATELEQLQIKLLAAQRRLESARRAETETQD